MRGLKFKGSITRRLVILMLSVTLLTGVVGYGSFLYWYMSMQQSRIMGQARTVALVLAQDLARLALLNDLAVAAELSAKLHSFEGLDELVFHQLDGRAAYQFQRDGLMRRPEPLRESLSEGVQREAEFLRLYVPAVYEGQQLGTVQMRFRLDTLLEVLKRDTLALLVIGALMLPFTLVLAIITGRRFTRPILTLVGFLEQIEKTAQLGARIPSRERNEFGKLYGEVNTMLARLQDSQRDQRLAAVAFETPSGMFITDASERIVRINDAFTQITGFTEAEVIGRSPSIFKSGRHDDAFYHTMYRCLQEEGVWSGEIWNRHKSGNVYPEQLTIHAVHDEQQALIYYVASFNDLTRLKEAESRLRYLSLHDALTGLPNREQLEQELLRYFSSGRVQQYGVLMCMDLKDFRMVNEARGHAVGDQILIEVAGRLKAHFDQARMVCRWAADEFVLWFTDLGQDPQQAALDAEQLAQDLCDHISAPFQSGEAYLQLESRVGLALYDQHSLSANQWIQQAVSALQQARQESGRQVVFFDAQAEAITQRYIQLYHALMFAEQNNELQLFYQIQTDETRRVVGAEALLRWHRAELGWISPVELIPVAERSGLIVPIGNWVLRSACQQLAIWAQMPGYDHLQIAVNVSGRQMMGDEFVETVQQLLQIHGVNPQRLKLELTESLLVEQLDMVSDKVARLREMGVGVSLDDFGTGYSSLSYLQNLPVSQIKIDQSFVRTLTPSSGEEAIVRTVLSLGEAFGFEVVAEGVETEAQFELLKQLGCKRFQGYLFGRPGPLLQGRFS